MPFGEIKLRFVASEPEAWAEETFGGCELGDRRRSARLVRMAGDIARRAGSSLLKACDGDEAAVEGMYRLLRNDSVDPAEIAEGGFAATARRARHCGALLAVEDSTTLSYGHSVREELGATSHRTDVREQGFIVHSVLLVDGESGSTVGLIEQQRWVRDAATHGKKRARKQRAYETKESYKWQRAGEAVRERLGEEVCRRTITVCDREADVSAYLCWQHSTGGRYVVRAAQDRTLCGTPEKLKASLARAPVLGTSVVAVRQRGGRAARQARVEIRGQAVTLGGAAGGQVACHALWVYESEAPTGVEPLAWLLLTSEPVTCREDALRVLWIYRQRWRIEEFHKAWKSGTRVEGLRPRTAANLERGVVILAFVATRLLQLREAVLATEARPDATPLPLAERPCDAFLSQTEWRVLYLATHKTRPPAVPPNVAWACRALAKLGGWVDTQRTGRPGWQVLWDGLQRLADRVEAHVLALEIGT